MFRVPIIICLTDAHSMSYALVPLPAETQNEMFVSLARPLVLVLLHRYHNLYNPTPQLLDPPPALRHVLLLSYY